MTGSFNSPPLKRIKLEDLSSIPELTQREEQKVDDVDTTADAEEGEGESCSICLQSLVDRTVIPKCSHEFCFECLLVWTEQSRRCPLCTQAIGDYLIHSIRSRYDYRKHYLLPLRTSPPPYRPAQNNPILQNTRNYARRRRREREWGTQRRDDTENDKLERSIEFRRWIYRHDVYAKHVASNSYTKYRPYPTPAQFSASQDLISRTTSFLRRELQVWEGLDVEFLTTLIISLMKAIDIRSESAVKLISEFLDMDAPYTPGGRHVNAEHFAHEVYCYVRSPYKDLFVYDSVVQYETPHGASPPPNEGRSQRPRASSSRDQASRSGQDISSSLRPRSRSRSPTHLRLADRPESWSPSGRKYSPPEDSKHRDVDESFPPQTFEEALDNGPSASRSRNEGSRHYFKSSKGGKSRKNDIVSSEPQYDYQPPNSPSRKRAVPMSSTDTTEKYSSAKTANVKGKQRAHEPVLADQSTSDRESRTGNSVPALMPPPSEGYSRNDVDQTPDLSTLRLASSSKTLRTPRIHSLAASVRAHLARNNGGSDTLSANTLTKLVPNGGVLNNQAQTLSTHEADDRDIHLAPADPSSMPQGPTSDLISTSGVAAAAHLNPENIESKSTLVDNISRNDKRARNGNLQETCDDSHPKINDTQSMSSTQSSLVIEGIGQVISDLNSADNDNTHCSSIDNTVNLNSGGTSSSWPSHAVSVPCAAGGFNPNSGADGASDRGSIRWHRNNLDAVGSESELTVELASTSSSSSPPLIMTDASASSIAIAGVGPHVSRSRSSHEDIPIRAPRHVNAASITDADDDRSQLEHMRSVHTQPVPQPLALEGPDDRRTRLLARLQLAKTQAWSDEGGGEAPGAGLSIRGAASSSSSSLSYHPRAGVRGVDTPPLSTRLSSPPSREGMGHRPDADAHKDAQSDPDTASGHIVDEAREKEAQLRLRARVRARLAAEKRAAAAG